MIQAQGAGARVVALDGTCTLGREDIGGKAWGVNRMRALGLRVPPAIAVTTGACRAYFERGRVLDDALWAEIAERTALLEADANRRFGSADRPLLVSVRSGAARSMPGMMDTVLNLGMNATVEAALARESGDARYAAETHERFREQFRKVVLRNGADAIPDDPWVQLRAAVGAVFDSWMSPRAQVYRRNRGVAEDGYTAVTIQAMVFGNLDACSGTGVLFSRNPITGDPPAWGEWLARGQGEEVVSGQRTPEPLDALRDLMPEVHAELLRAADLLERDARDLQDVEFTVEAGRLWLLQCRVAKRSPQAALRAAVAMAQEGLISREEAVRRLASEPDRRFDTPVLAPEAADQRPLATGEPACPGVATGVVVVEPERAEALARTGEAVILARATTSPEDLYGIIAAHGVMTEQGGSTSHAAVVSRELGRPCVVGCGSGTVTRLAGQRVTLDGSTGNIWAGDLTRNQTRGSASADVAKLVAWGRTLIPLALCAPEEAPSDTVDLDRLGPEWERGLAPGIAVRGRMLETESGIRSALAARVATVVVPHPLPALLACLRAASMPAPPAIPVQAAGPAAAPISELALLRLLGLKGRAAPEIVADSLAVPRDEAMALYLPLCARGLCTSDRTGLRLTPQGREQTARLLAEERGHVDAAAIVTSYEEFCVFDAELKRVMTAWQVKPDGAANDHADAAYDREVLGRLAALHASVAALLARLAMLSPRLAGYRQRLDRAAARIAAGDRAYVARIIADSYHTVWFELHDELMSLAGVSRRAQAAAESRKL